MVNKAFVLLNVVALSLNTIALTMEFEQHQITGKTFGLAIVGDTLQTAITASFGHAALTDNNYIEMTRVKQDIVQL